MEGGNDADAGASRGGAAEDPSGGCPGLSARDAGGREPAATRVEEARLAQQRQSEALAAATAEYRRLTPFAPGDQRAVSGEVNRMIAAAINVNPEWFWHGPDA
jgi:hypothetical protein